MDAEPGNQRIRRLWLPPRSPGEVVKDRTVGFIELFYDLVYVVLIAVAAHNLAVHVSWSAVGEFALVFTLIWIAWLNGTVYHDLHGREDIRSRTYIFVQMLLVALLAVYAGDGADGSGSFSILYGAFLALLAWLWHSVPADGAGRYRKTLRPYLASLLLTAAAMVGSAFAPPALQPPIWMGVVLLWLCTGLYVTRAATEWYDRRVVSESLVERFGLFTIIVLGEVIVRVVHGLSASTRGVHAMTTGLLSLGIGFGLWWVYFDLVGRRLPRTGRNGLPVWMFLHLPLTMAVATAGAVLSGVIEHAEASHAPEVATWVLAGSVGIALATIAGMVRTLEVWVRHRSILSARFHRAELVGGRFGEPRGVESLPRRTRVDPAGVSIARMVRVRPPLAQLSPRSGRAVPGCATVPREGPRTLRGWPIVAAALPARCPAPMARARTWMAPATRLSMRAPARVGVPSTASYC